jgi:RimJ/RimL family protein N-acetyltransferase
VKTETSRSSGTAITTGRLRLAPLREAQLDVFHGLVTDPHVRRYLMDGQVLPREWSREQIDATSRDFAAHGVGLWLARDRALAPSDPRAMIGFAGCLRLPGTGLGWELVYALREAHTGRGLACEMARGVIERARSVGLEQVEASVDAVNLASVRILERLGFALVERGAGAFGELRIYRLELRSAG